MGGLAAGPFLDLLQRSPEFWVAHGLGVGSALGLALVVLLGLGGALAAATAPLPSKVRAAARRWSFAGLVALASMPALSQAFPDSQLGAPAIAGLCGVAISALAARSGIARQVADAVAIAPALYLASFVSSGLPQRLAEGGSAPSFAAVARPGAVVVAVFDELPLVSLLAPDGRIDAERFPNFASLARDAIWFPNTSAAAGLTTLALPAILTGRHPDPEKLPLHADHPSNLLAWLGAQMPLRAQEPRTRLLPPQYRATDELVAAQNRRASRLVASDVALVYAHFALPRALASSLPPVDEDWAGFAARAADPRAHELSELARERRGHSKVTEFFEFLDSLTPCPDACAIFVHSVLPHVPWMYTPTGTAYPTWALTPGLSQREKRWSHDETWVGEAWQRHLFQVHLVDLMLGRLVARLRSLGLYDRALVMVTADHGISLRPGVRERALSAAHPHPEDLLRVPLFVRAPGRARGVADPRPAASVDLAATIADFLGSELPWPHDGISLLAAADAAPRPPRIAVAVDGERIAVPGDLAQRGGAQEFLRRVLPVGGGIDGLYARGAHAPMLFGREIAGLPIEAAAGPPEIELADATLPPDRTLPLRLIGRVSTASSDPQFGASRAAIAAAVGGRIRAVAPLAPGPDARPVFSLFLPDALSAQPFDALALYLVSGAPDAPRLERTRLHTGLAFRELFSRGLRGAVAPVAEDVGNADAE